MFSAGWTCNRTEFVVLYPTTREFESKRLAKKMRVKNIESVFVRDLEVKSSYRSTSYKSVSVFAAPTQ